MLSHQNKDETDGRREAGSPLMSWLRKFKPRRHHRSGSPEKHRPVEEEPRARNIKRDSGTSSVGSDEDLAVYEEEMFVGASNSSSQDDNVPKPPGSGETVLLVSRRSQQGDGLLQVTTIPLDEPGQQGEKLYKVDCKGKYDNSNTSTRFVWSIFKPKVERKEGCSGVYLGVYSTDEKHSHRLCCHKMKDGKISLAAHEVSDEFEINDPEGMLYVCYHKDRGGVITIQENVSDPSAPAEGLFIGATSDGELQAFPGNYFQPYTSNPFVDFYIMDLIKTGQETESTKRMNGEK